MNRDTRTAWLNGAFVVLGAVIAGVAGLVGPFVLQRVEDRREDRREAREVRAAARLLFAEMYQSGTQTAILANDRILRRFDPSFRVEMRPEDMRLVASKLDGERWGAVLNAITSIEGLETFVNTQLERGRRRLSKGEVCYALIDLRAVRLAAEALAPLADAPGRPPPPGPLECQPRPGPIPGRFP